MFRSLRLLVPSQVLALALLGANSTHGCAEGSRRYHVDGPVAAELVSVIDGDTVLVNARPWPQQTISVMVRLRGVDTPELKSRCPEERDRARAARDLLEERLQAGDLQLSDIDADKYFGRVVARLTFGETSDASDLLLAAGLARPYGGGKKAPTSC
ncbi:micrococcal nuclease [Rhizobium sp. SG_E_25_P2]|uniref:thermonuclease family protein n=1 Tax=Rhizobium sp. SG_E_25_P2 TaxID=2879942 RepID=UPI0024749BD9|nr:thermonuclease family protein [Rhizobium sp. SG_E_25_P2]MDH6269359.1 micrococcal nuclease [Rhizobium sp. SG_E_25_P2]